MKKTITILSALLLMGSCSKESNCKSNIGSVEIYVDMLSACRIYGGDSTLNYTFNAYTSTKIDLTSGKYYIVVYKNTGIQKKDSFDVKRCENVKLSF